MEGEADLVCRRENGEHKMAEVMGMWTMKFIEAKDGKSAKSAAA